MTASDQMNMGVGRSDRRHLSAAMSDHSQPHSEDALLAACRRGAPDAMATLIAQYRPLVHAAIARYLRLRCRGRTDLADDLTHEVFLALFRDDGARLRQFEGRNGCSLGGWLRVVAVRLTIDLLRRERRLTSLDAETPSMTELRRVLVSTDAGPEDLVVGVELGERLQAAVATLGSRDRLLIELHILRGRSLDDVATMLGVTMNAVYVRKSRVLDRLRTMLRLSQ